MPAVKRQTPAHLRSTYNVRVSYETPSTICTVPLPTMPTGTCDDLRRFFDIFFPLQSHVDRPLGGVSRKRSVVGTRPRSGARGDWQTPCRLSWHSSATGACFQVRTPVYSTCRFMIVADLCPRRRSPSITATKIQFVGERATPTKSCVSVKSHPQTWRLFSEYGMHWWRVLCVCA